MVVKAQWQRRYACAPINQFVTSDDIDENMRECKLQYDQGEHNGGESYEHVASSGGGDAGVPLDEELWLYCMMHYGMPLMSEWRPIEMAWILFEISFFSDMRHQKHVRSAKRMPSKIGVGQLAYASDVLVVVSFSLRCVMEVIARSPGLAGGGGTDDGGSSPAEDRLKELYKAYQIIISVKVALIFLQTLLYLIIYRPLGVLVVTLGDMVQDVGNFGILLLVTICSFMAAFSGLQKAGSLRSVKDEDPFRMDAKDGPLYAPWWALFGLFDPTQSDSMVKMPSWQCPSPAPAAPQCAPGVSGQLGAPRVRPSRWAPRPQPRGLKRAASKVASSTALDRALTVPCLQVRPGVDGLHVALHLHLLHRAGQPAHRHVLGDVQPRQLARRAGVPAHVLRQGAATWSKCPLGSAPARPLCLLRARLAAPGSSALPG